MSSSLLEWLQSSTTSDTPIYLLDGGVSTHLRELYQKDFEHKELWSSSLLLTPEGCDTILQGHKDWLSSGSNVLTTVTYQCHSRCSPVLMDAHKLEQMLQKGVELAQRAIREQQQDEHCPRFVVASMGCYGAALADGSEYTGHYPAIRSEQDLIDFHRHKTQALLQANPDGIALETVPCVAECRAFVALLKELQQQQQNQEKNSQTLPACWISLACRNGHELNDGSKLEEALKAIDDLDPQAELVHAIGVNCCDSQHIPSLAKLLVSSSTTSSAKRRAIALYPNSGEEWDAETKTWKEGTGLRHNDLQDVFANRLMEAVETVQQTWKELRHPGPPPRILLGGCCRTRPETIRALRSQVDLYLQQQEQQQSSTTPPSGPAALTAEQERKLAAILGRDADFDSQLNEIGGELDDLVQLQQQQGEAVAKQTTSLQNINHKKNG